MAVLQTVDSTTSPSAAATVGSVWKMKRDGLGQDERASAGVTEKQPVELAYVGSQFTDGQDRDGLSYGELVIEG
jgi:hypothetical protein